MRLFTAIELPEPAREQVSQLYLEHIRQVRWSLPDQLHLTLAFLGEVAPHELDPVIESLAEIEFKPMKLHCTRPGYFRNGTIWLGVEPSPGLLQLQRAVSQQLRHCGVTLPRRRYVPHITLGRCDSVQADLLAQLERQALGFHCEFECSEFVLKRSILRPQGAEHITEVTFLAETQESVRARLKAGRP